MVNKLYESVDIVFAKLASAVRELAEKDIRITELESERIILGTALGWLAEAAEGYIEYKPGVDWNPGENCIDELLDALEHVENIMCDIPTDKVQDEQIKTFGSAQELIDDLHSDNGCVGITYPATQLHIVGSDEEIDGSSLTGYVKHSGLHGTHVQTKFLSGLQALMEEHKIDKLDIGWAGPWNQAETDRLEKLRHEIRLDTIEERAKYIELPSGDIREDLLTEVLAADLRHMAKITK